MNRAAVTLALIIFLSVSICLSVPIYSLFRAETAKDVDGSQSHNEYEGTPVVSRDYDFSPPISMYQALRIALESDGWNATSLSNMTISARLDYGRFGNYTGPNVTSYARLGEVTQEADNYDPVTVNGTTYRYYWEIVVEYSGSIVAIPPPGYYFVDAVTGEIIPQGILS